MCQKRLSSCSRVQPAGPSTSVASFQKRVGTTHQAWREEGELRAVLRSKATAMTTSSIKMRSLRTTVRIFSLMMTRIWMTLPPQNQQSAPNQIRQSPLLRPNQSLLRKHQPIQAQRLLPKHQQMLSSPNLPRRPQPSLSLLRKVACPKPHQSKLRSNRWPPTLLARARQHQSQRQRQVPVFQITPSQRRAKRANTYWPISKRCVLELPGELRFDCSITDHSTHK